MEKINILTFKSDYILFTLFCSLVVALGILFEPTAAIIAIVLLSLLTLSVFHWDKIIWFAVPTFYLGFPLFVWPLSQLELGVPTLSLLILPLLVHIANKLIRGRIYKQKIDWSIMAPVMIFTIFLYSSLLWTPNFDYGFKKIIIFSIQALLPTVILLTSRYSSGNIKLLGISLQFLACFCALQLFFWGGEEALYPGRNTLPSVNPIWLSRIAILGIIASIWNLTSLKGNRKFIFNGMVILLSLWVVVSTGSRGPILAFIFSSIVITVLSMTLIKRFSSIKFFQYSIIIAMSIFIIFVPVLISPEEAFRYINIPHDPTTISLDENINARLQSYAIAYSHFKQNFLIGKGIGGYSEYLRDYPHNLILEILSEGGSIGVIFFLVIIINLFRKIFLGELAMSHAILFLTAFIFALTSGDLASNYEWLIIGVFLSRTGNEK